MDPMLASDWTDLFEVPNLLFVAMAAVGVVAIVFGTVSAAITKIAVSRDRERTRRELAAYVAEGSIEADKAIAMLSAGGGETEKL